MFKDIKIKSKLYSLLTILLIGFAVLGYAITKASDNTISTNERLLLLSQIESEPVKIMMNLRGYQLLFKDDFIKEYDEGFKNIDIASQKLYNILLAEHNRILIKEITTLIKEWQELNVPRVAMLKEYQRKITDDSFPESENGLKLAVLTKKSADIFKTIEAKITTLKDGVIKVNLDNAENIAKISNFTIVIIASISILFVLLLIKDIISRISSIQQGLNSFFSFLNRQTNKAELINLDSKDEFGEMAKIINENISSIEKEIAMDNKLVDEAKHVITRVQHGWYSQYIESTTTNASLEEFKNGVNSMIVATKAHFVAMNVVLEEYAAYNYTKELKLDGIEKGGVFEILVNDINKLRDAVTQMLQNSLSNGVELQDEASTLKQAVESLSTASNQQAASLEETAAAMEEMTSNVQNNVAKSNEMATMAKETDGAAREGAILASRTASAMTEIQSATASINDAVAIIENIAFQTNILSLNAAVEAATAGEAGRGFAVVAQEVRNLANRSAEAAKEIKEMASQAAGKSNEGMNIATELTRGFEVIADKIAQTASMVQDVSNANREQMQGIGQINTAVTQLDQMTQENAKVAAQADAIANATIQKAEAMVQDAESKEFIGKNNIRTTQTASRTNKTPQAAKPVVVSKNTHTSKALPKKGSAHDGDVWESF